MAGFPRHAVTGVLSWLMRQHTTTKHAEFRCAATLISAHWELEPLNPRSSYSTSTAFNRPGVLSDVLCRPQNAFWRHASANAASDQRRGIQSECLYIHHTGGYGRHSDAVPIGFAYALERHEQDIGFFRPIATSKSARGEVISRVLELKDDNPADTIAFHQSEAFEYLATNRSDELLEKILQAYEKYKRQHKFVLIEGTSFGEVNERVDVDALNARICSMLGAPAIFAINCARLTTPSGESGPAKLAPRQVPNVEKEFQEHLVAASRLSQAAFAKENVEVVAALAHRVPGDLVNTRVQGAMRQQLGEAGLLYAGAIPDDDYINAATVVDVQQALGAEILYGGQSPPQMNTEVTQYVVATLNLQELLTYFPKHLEPTKGAVVITNAGRPDVILAMQALQKTAKLANCAALVLTGGGEPSKEIDLVLRSHKQEDSLPVLLARLPTFDTAAKLYGLEGRILPSSDRKIERAKHLFDSNIDFGPVVKALLKDQPTKLNPKLFVYNLYKKAAKDKQRIVLPEGTEPRIILAAAEALRRGLCHPILLGPEEEILTQAKQLRVDLSEATIIDPASSPDLEKYVDLVVQQRKHKGMTPEQAHQQLTQDVNVFGTAMVKAGDASGMVSGAIHTTANTVRPALQIIKMDPGIPVVSSVFFMCLPDKVLVYGDCAINTNPNADELASIAMASADSAKAFGLEPRVAMLSYATGDSNQGPAIQKVIDATRIAQQQRPELAIEGPLQYDAAVNPQTAKTKLKGRASKVAGQANVLIFPDLNTGNNTYKAVQQSTGALAIGPMLQGLRKPVNDLSRGCTVADVVTTICLTSIQAQARASESGQAPQ
ncbi:phosphate acetyltransferase [Klebsormidium nitens]|uniref:Phosphate acetyltransferase n=1 Tax=Klebsormidium nitens TaxID=105231 RepID=A0A1Y1IGA3_KLENI|nr:phosphate acetyltransferase [Klebsormidium nitens]|eukprot:GAQ89874.1 phosphate acetyltransferase [Klebsormidium nitens]